ncbi:MAG: AMP-binding protein [Pseudomonadota bacterium]
MRYFGATLPVPADLSLLLRRGLEIRPQHTALVTSDGTWSYAELEEKSIAYARGLIAGGMKPGDRIASLLPNCSKLFVHYLGAKKAGLVAVPLNYRYTAFEIEHTLSESGANAIAYDKNRSDDIDETETGRSIKLRIACDPDQKLGDDTFEKIAASGGNTPLPEVDPNAPGTMFFTSGSTGPAKGVTHSRRTMEWIIASAAKSYQLAPDDVFMAASSCSHIGGFINTLCSWSEGATVVAPRIADPEGQVALMRKHRPTILLMIPSALFNLERHPNVKPEDYSSLRLIVSGGDKVPKQLERELVEKTGLALDEAYGMTEIGLSHVNPSSGLVKFGSMGRVAPGFMAEVRDEAGTPVGTGVEGKLFVKFPGTTIGYWGRPDATKEVYDDNGWFDTGDIVKVDEEGYFYFCGRKKQIIIHNAYNIFPQEVEDILLEHEAVAAAGVIGIQDVLHGENVRAYVTFKDGVAHPSAAELIAFAAKRVGYKAPEEIVVLDEMPLNPTGKVDRVALKKSAAERSNAQVA